MAELISNKQILWYKTKLRAYPGKMTVSETHFSFYQLPKWAMMFGLLGALLAGSAKGNALVDDEISNLKFSKGRTLGKKSFMLEVTTADGHTYEFLVDNSLMEQMSPAISLD
jgi:hypothetical protein